MPNRFHPAPTLPGRKFQNDTARLWPDDMKIAPLGFGLPYLFGDGSDGDTTISINTNYDTGTIKQFRNYTINSGITVSITASSSPGIIIIYASERINIQGTISVDGCGGEPNYDYTTSYAGSGGGGGGGSDTAGLAGSDSAVGTNGLAGGIGAAGGNATAITTYQKCKLRMEQTLKDYLIESWGCAGGRGGNGVTAYGGAGGDGGGSILLFAEEILLGSSSLLSADGNNGSNGEDQGLADCGGGGGGGGGGLIYVCCRKFTNLGSSNITIAGGSGGTAGNVGAGNGGTGASGTYIPELIPK